MLASWNFPLFKALETPNIQFSVDPMAAGVTSIIRQNIEVTVGDICLQNVDFLAPKRIRFFVNRFPVFLSSDVNKLNAIYPR
jgi:hypothetical protein